MRTVLGVLGAVAAIGALLVPAAPHRPGPVAVTGATATRAGAPGLAEVWPHARPFTFPAVLPDGSAYAPVAVLDDTTSVGTASSPDGNRSGLVQVGTDGTVRSLDWQPAADDLFLDAFAASGSQFFWMRTVTGPRGEARISLWSAGRRGGTPVLLSGDVGAASFSNSGYDLQVVDGRVYWVATGAGGDTELRSMPVGGGATRIRRIPGQWALTAWPWLTSAPGAAGTPASLVNLDTGERRTVRTPADQLATCTPVWCRMIAGNATDPTDIVDVRPDGTGRERVGGPQDVAVAGDVALLDRFEIIATPDPDTATAIATERVTLYDLRDHRGVLLAAQATQAVARGPYVWWATGDHETLAYHGLSLNDLG